jgi:hypothetical protein
VKDYINNYNETMAIKDQCVQEDKEYKEIEYKKAKKLKKIEKEKFNEKNKYSSTIGEKEKSEKIENFMNSTYGTGFVSTKIERSVSFERNPLIEKFEKENKLVAEIIK